MRDIGKVGIIYSILAVAFITFGIGLFVDPELSYALICRIAGGILIVYGIVKMVSYFTGDLYQLAFQFDLAMGIFSLVLGIMLSVFTENVMTRFPTFIGIIILIDAVFKVQTSLDAKKFGLTKWWLILILAVLAGAAGVLLIFHPLEMSGLILRLMGLNLILDGVLNLWVVLYTVRIKRINGLRNL